MKTKRYIFEFPNSKPIHWNRWFWDLVGRVIAGLISGTGGTLLGLTIAKAIGLIR